MAALFTEEVEEASEGGPHLEGKACPATAAE